MKECDIILTSILQADGKYKNRPALILKKMPKYNDFLMCGISGKLQQYIKNFDEIISITDNDFLDTGLKQSSLIRLSFLSVIPSKNIIGNIGFISKHRHQILLHNLSNYLIENRSN
ncbi:type II toxin-antitoxin system PemK/MazF family toxin [Geminocystis herdmanii]|uniref:type II toxin-antitoxin system PemK/MazF family toxin n=1 Tax=Geminocystis herdmanii TaxID=669359 RepID=UPI000346181E|nr:type II toxin-antitoxin system PemK/MazF family toxin [Geminocystis herdmanii]